MEGEDAQYGQALILIEADGSISRENTGPEYFVPSCGDFCF